MKRDFTMWGCGLITGHLVWVMLTKDVGTANWLLAVGGLVLIIGSRYGIFGRSIVTS